MLEGHEDEIFSCAFNYEGDTIITGSKDNTCRIWRDQTMMSDKDTPQFQGQSDKPSFGGLQQQNQ